MSEKIKVAKKIKFLVTITYNIDKDFIKQKYTFWVNNKKHLCYAYDKRYLLKQKLDACIKENLLEYFKCRNDNIDNIEMIYYNKDQEIPSIKTINMEFYLPPFNGCKYCTKAKKEGDFIYCEEKKKHYDSMGIKNCKVFSSIEEVLT